MKNKNIRAATGGLLFAVVLSGVIFTLPSASADVVDEIEITVPISCSMSSTVSSEHASEVNNGQTVSDIGTTNLKVICNDNSGYAIYAIGYTDDTYGKTVLTNPAISSTNDIITSTTVTTGTSSWAMKLAAVSGTYTPIIAGSTGDDLKATGDPDFSDYTAVPEEYTKVAYHTSSTDTGTNATGSNLTTTYRAYISPSQPAGTYIGQVKYTLVHPNTMSAPGVYTIAFNANGGSGVMDSKGVSSLDSFVLPESTFTAPLDYTFDGWCTVQDSNQNPQTTCSGTKYASGDSVTGLGAGGSTVNLYAVWGKFMQAFTLADCQVNVGANGNPSNIGDEIKVFDERTGNYIDGDNGSYTVRYINGTCWMTQNLRISGVVSAEFSNFETSPYSGSDTIDLYAGGDFKDTNDTFAAPMMHMADVDDVSENDGLFTITELGGYYNYCAASAGQSCTNTQVGATQDICPSGWRLPTGGSPSEHQTLINNLGGNIALFNPVAAGGYVDTVLYGGVGYYWSRSARSATNRWDIYYYQNVYRVGNISADYGLSIRCMRVN